MKKTFVIQVEYPDNDVIPSEEVIEVTQECIDQYLEGYFGANIMDGDYDRIKVKEVTDGFTLVKRMRECQRKIARFVRAVDPITYDEYEASNDVFKLEKEVDEYLEKMEE